MLAERPGPSAIPALLLSLRSLGPVTLAEVLHAHEPVVGDVALAWLCAPDAQRRHAAALALVEIRNPWSVEPLLNLRMEAEPEVRKAMCLALAHQCPDVAPRVLHETAASDPDPRVQSFARDTFRLLAEHSTRIDDCGASRCIPPSSHSAALG
jgi:HEAT repeat protein